MPMIDVINEHRLYLAAAGFFAALTTAIFLGVAYWQERYASLPWITIFLLLLVAGIFGMATHQRNQIWQSEITLWKDVVKKSPGKARAYDELGLAHARQGQFAKAIPFYHRAIALNPIFSRYYSDLGVAYASQGDNQQAIEMFQRTLQLDPENSSAYNNLGVTYSGKANCKSSDHVYPRPADQSRRR